MSHRMTIISNFQDYVIHDRLSKKYSYTIQKDVLDIKDKKRERGGKWVSEFLTHEMFLGVRIEEGERQRLSPRTNT